MSSDPRTALETALAEATGKRPLIPAAGRRPVVAPVSGGHATGDQDRQLVDSGDLEQARQLFSDW